MNGGKTIKKNRTVPGGYKETAVQKPPPDWKSIRLGELVGIVSGNSPSGFKLAENGEVPYIKVEDLNNTMKYQDKSRHYTDTTINTVPPNSIIFPKRGAAILTNKVRINSRPIHMDSNMMAIFVTSNKITPEYLFYQIINEKLFKIADTSTIPQINHKHIIPYRIALPPLPEQQKIAAILSTWDEAIEKTQSLIDQLRQRNKGLAQQLLTGKKRLPGFAKASASKKRVTTEWKVYSVAEIFDFLKNASFSRDNLGDGNFYYLHYGDIHVKFRQPILKVTGNETIPRLKYEFETSNNFDLLQNGDVVIADASEDTEGIGDCIEIQNVGVAKVIAGLHTIALRDSMGLTAQLFRGYYFKSDTIRNQLRKLATGISVYGISKTSVKKIRMILPPKPEQEAIAQVLEQANEELHLYEQKLVTLQFQKKGLMQKLLTGELRVKTNVI